MGNSSYFKSLEAKAKGNYCEKLSCVVYLSKTTLNHGYILSVRTFGKCFKNGSELLRLWL